MPVRRRTKAREIALRLLYQWDIRGSEAESALLRQLRQESRDKEVLSFSARLLQGVMDQHQVLDDKIRKVADNWELRRMAYIDRNILRLAIFELLFCPEIPPKVSINEAIELGKKYSTKQSGAFVNGILDRISKEKEATNGTQTAEGRTEKDTGKDFVGPAGAPDPGQESG